MRQMLGEKMITIVVSVFSIIAINNTKPSVPVEEHTMPMLERRVLTTDTINNDSLLAEAKKTAMSYKKSELAKKSVEQKEIAMIKTEIALSKEQTKITKELISKLRKRFKLAENQELVLRKDSVCTRYSRGLSRVFKGKRCLEYDTTLYVVVDGKRYNLNKD